MKHRNTEFKVDATLTCSAMGSPVSGSWVPRLGWNSRSRLPILRGREGRARQGHYPLFHVCMCVYMYLSSNIAYVLSAVLGAYY